MADYCTIQEVKANPDLGISNDVEYDAALANYVTRASRMIDRYLGKWDNYFYPSTDAVARYYTGGDEPYIDIDEATEISTVAVSEFGEVTSTGYTAWGSTDWYAWPYNYSANSEPIRRIYIDDVNGSQYSFGGYRKGVKVTGVWGFSATPPNDIKQACIIQATALFMQEKQGWRDASASPELGQMIYTKALHPTAAAILDAYKHKVSLVP